MSFPTLLLAAAVLANPSGALRQALRGLSFRLAGGVLLSTLVLGLLLDWMGAWPFTWRSPGNSTPVHLASLLGAGNEFGVVLLAVRVVLIIPLIEEVMFRYVLLRKASRLPGGTHTGVLTSAAAFGVLHMGTGGDTVMALNAVWMFVFSLLLGWATYTRGGTLGFAFAAHASRNGAELLALYLAVVRSL